ncbi:uncharacterized protein LOC131430798 [Malaya genurostris]|uniref:uncharacterized protein LOC131430798 n=1 Tax=Malaya genurostris TaxID=325434 RepID=UPI0026F3CD65|nr:uncharacterized protein LOC131430798 [Malaya genurostris]
MNIFQKGLLDKRRATLSQLDSDEEEPDFTNGNYTMELCTDVSIDDDCVPLDKCYKPDDLYPKARNPDYIPSWPLELYHPIYVGNFKILAWDQHVWYKQVSEYFAYKGLLTRMVYFPQLSGDPFVRFQEANRLIDMLVYFASPGNARKAIECCHGDSYYGHKLNVLSGRRPLYFDSLRSVKICLPDKITNCDSETFIENALSEFGKVVYVMKCSVQKAFVEFSTKKSMLNAIAKQTSYTPVRIKKKQVMKQRIIEFEAMKHIMSIMKIYPLFMEMKPEPETLQYLIEGKRPLIDMSWKNHDVPVPSENAKIYQETKQLIDRRKIQRRLISRAKNLSLGNQNSVQSSPSTSGQPIANSTMKKIPLTTQEIIKQNKKRFLDKIRTKKQANAIANKKKKQKKFKIKNKYLKYLTI